VYASLTLANLCLLPRVEKYRGKKLQFLYVNNDFDAKVKVDHPSAAVRVASLAKAAGQCVNDRALGVIK
jgi:hypothetical protein